MRHAYLIMAHKNQEQLAILIQMLDHPSCDLFVHLDAKWTNCDLEYLKNRANNSRIYFTERVSVEWGKYSQVQAELILLHAAVNHGGYDFYHFITGQDLPLKSMEEINAFFENTPEQNYIHFCDDEAAYHAAISRAYRYCLPDKGRCLRILNKVLARCLCKVGEKTWLKKRHFGYGSAYFDITDFMAKMILDKENWIKKHFRTYSCPDELFLQTVVNEFGYKNKCYFDISNSYKQVNRYIDFARGNGCSPYVFREKDFDELMNSDMPFARKFDWELDKVIIEKIFNRVCGKKEGMC